MNNSLKFSGFYRLPGILVCFIFAFYTGTGCTDTNKKVSSVKKPNIILVMIDNLGFSEIGINGNELVNTPHLDRFASEGVRFGRFLSNPMCAPTRASLMTGRYHYRTGVIHTSRGGAKMFGDEVTIAELLKKEGYATGIFGKWHLGDNYPMRPRDQGFNETLIHKSGRLGQVPDSPGTYIDPKLWENGQYVQKQGYCTDLFFDAAIDFIEKHQDKPFFIYLPTNIAHTSLHVGLEVPQKYSEPYTARGYGKEVATVCGMLDNFDENFGRLIARLNELGIRNETLVIFLGDDGNVRVNTGNYRGKGYAMTYEGSIKVPCFIQWPGHFKGGEMVDQVASHIDILPTLLDIIGTSARPDSAVDGMSLLPLLEGKADHWPDRLIFLQCHRGMTPQRYQNFAVISESFKLIGYPNTFEDRQLVTSRDGPAFELYDIPADHAETTNLADRNPDVMERLKTAYDQWFDDVRSSRQFSPGLIHIGSDAENPVYLCRYQDATYIDQQPVGWPVFIERQGKYEITVNRGESSGKGFIFIQYDSVLIRQPIGQGENQAVFTLPEGQVMLNIWSEEEGRDYAPRPNEDRIGDVLIRRITE